MAKRRDGPDQFASKKPRLIDNDSYRSEEDSHSKSAEQARLTGDEDWKLWGPYLSERQWGTVREDHSADGNCWEYFPFDHSTFRTYQSGEDGLLGICDDKAQLCISLALWNGKDSILKERLFGLAGPEGNHGEDVKEIYFYIDSTPTHSYMKALYKYPQAEFPYAGLRKANKELGKKDAEFELLDTGLFNCGRYWDVYAEYAKQNPHDIFCRYQVVNRSSRTETLYLLPTVWFRDTWTSNGVTCQKPEIGMYGDREVICTSNSDLGNYIFAAEKECSTDGFEVLFTNNETNMSKLSADETVKVSLDSFTKDAFHEYLINGNTSAVNPCKVGTKCTFVHRLRVPAGSKSTVRCRLYRQDCDVVCKLGKEFDNVINQRLREAGDFYDIVIKSDALEERDIIRKAYAGLCWTKQYYQYDGKLTLPKPIAINPEKSQDVVGEDLVEVAKEAEVQFVRNVGWDHLKNSDIISMPDKWEFPWYATWDLAFHMIPLSTIDLDFVKSQLLLFISDRYQHPNGQLPAYEYDFNDVNPPVHAWACLHVVRRNKGSMDVEFLKTCLEKLSSNFNWWMNNKKNAASYLFSGGFLGMDNISCLDRSHLPFGVTLDQADGTAWMAFYARCLMEMALEISKIDPTYEDLAVTYLEHFASIAKDINGSTGLWDDNDNFYYDRLNMMDEAGNPSSVTLRIRSLVGLISLLPALLLEADKYRHLPTFTSRMNSLLPTLSLSKEHREGGDWDAGNEDGEVKSVMLSLVSRLQFQHLIKYILDKEEFLSDFGIRSLSKYHEANPFELELKEELYSISYCPSESNSNLFGGNSNWRGPIWICLNYLLFEAMDSYGSWFQDELLVELPTGSSEMSCPLLDVLTDIQHRIIKIFLTDSRGRRPVNGDHILYKTEWKNMINFYEYFDAETGQGLGASHQTGWTALIVNMLDHRRR